MAAVSKYLREQSGNIVLPITKAENVIADDSGNNIKTYLDNAAGKLQTEVDDVQGQIHTNLLNPTLETTTSSGVTITNNNDGTFTLNGTATGGSGGNVWFNLFGAGIRPALESIGAKVGHKYRFTCTPHGGSTTTYWSNVSVYKGSTLSESRNDTGNGQEIEIDADETNLQVGINIRVGTALDNVVFKPMLTTDLSADYESFVKYGGSEERLNEQVASLHESSKGLITNLIESTLDTMTINGVTCTANGDGTFTLNGTATNSTYFLLAPRNTVESFGLEHNKSYRISGCPKTGSNSTYLWEVYTYNSNNSLLKDNRDIGQGKTFSLSDNEARIEMGIRVYSGTTVNNATFKPMLTTDLDATYNDYVPYSGDGRLNENVAALFDKVEEHALNTSFHTVAVGETYTAPCDGYVLVGSGPQAGTYSKVLINGVLPIDVVSFNAIDKPPRTPLFVKKGMTIKHESSNSGICYFFELN